MARQYRRYGGIAFMRVIVVYSFILYCMCAFLLTVLPLPSFEAVEKMPTKSIGWIPFFDLYTGLKNAGFSLSTPSTLTNLSIWKQFLTSSDLFQILANIVMLIPMGFYLRYYFKRSWKQTIIIGFCTSLFFELTQLSGLFFLYPKAYRYTEVDDLINNTLGTMIGFWITPLLAKLLPSRDEIDKISYDKGHRITVMRRFFAAFIDWLLFFVLWMLLLFIPVQMEPSMWFVCVGFFGYFLWVILYFVLLQWLLKGQTLGKSVAMIKVVREDNVSPPSFGQLMTRYSMIYFLTAPLTVIEIGLLAVLGLFAFAEGAETFRIWMIVGCVAMIALTLFVILHSFRKWGMFPHGHYSHTTIVLSGQRKPFKELIGRRGRRKKANEAAPLEDVEP